MAESQQTPCILHVEDDPNDALFVRMALEKLTPPPRVDWVKDGQEALDYLGAAGVHKRRAGQALPNLVLLDLKLPRLNGFEVLNWIRAQPGLQALPVVVLSGSSIIEDKQRALNLGATVYFVKTPFYLDILNYVGSLVTPGS